MSCSYIFLYYNPIAGAKGVVCGPEVARLADNRVPTKLRKCHLFLPSPTNACPRHGPWATSQTAKTCRGVKRVPDALVRAGQLTDTTPTEKHRSPRIAEGWAWGCNSTQTKKYCYET